MNTLLTLETNCRHLAALRGQLRQKFETRQSAQNLLDAAHNPGIRELQEQCQTLRTTLLDNLATGRDLFLQRKTQEFHGITVGFEKERDSVTFPSEEILVDRIEKMLPATQSKTLLDRTVKVIKSAFKKLPLETLQKLGCSVIKGGDKSIVRANDDDIEALVHKSLGCAPPASPPPCRAAIRPLDRIKSASLPPSDLLEKRRSPQRDGLDDWTQVHAPGKSARAGVIQDASATDP